MPLEVDLRPSPEKPLGYFFSLLSLHHLHNRQGKLQRPLLCFPFRERPDGNSVPIWEWVRHCLKFLSIDSDPLGLCVAHSPKLIADFMKFD